MSIKLLRTIANTLPTIGKIRKGAPKPEKGVGRDLDYFRMTSDNPAIVEALQKTYGTEPKEIECLLAFSDLEKAFFTAYEAWNRNTLISRCDGERILLEYDPARNNYTRNPSQKFCQKDPESLTPCEKCSAVGRLSIILPPMSKLGYHGIFVLETHSIHDLINITGSLGALAELFQKEKLTSIPFVLTRRAKKIAKKIGETRKREETSLVFFEVHPDVSRHLAAEQERFAIEGFELPRQIKEVSAQEEVPQLKPAKVSEAEENESPFPPNGSIPFRTKDEGVVWGACVLGASCADVRHLLEGIEKRNKGKQIAPIFLARLKEIYELRESLKKQGITDMPPFKDEEDEKDGEIVF